MFFWNSTKIRSFWALMKWISDANFHIKEFQVAWTNYHQYYIFHDFNCQTLLENPNLTKNVRWRICLFSNCTPFLHCLLVENGNGFFLFNLNHWVIFVDQFLDQFFFFFIDLLCQRVKDTLWQQIQQKLQ
jgi:hypothetical protein